MRISIIIIILFFSTKISGQEVFFFQSDSIYKLNKVKEVKYFIKKNRLAATIFFDRNGRTIKYQGEPSSSGRQKSEYFKYDKKGRLTKRYDVIEDKYTEVINYKIEYSNEEMTKLTKFNPDGSIKSITYYEEKGKKRTTNIYRNGEIVLFSISEYFNGVNLNKEIGWHIPKDSEKNEFNNENKYTYSNGKITQYIRYRNGKEKTTTKFKYNEKNLIIAVECKGHTEQYKYKYY